MVLRLFAICLSITFFYSCQSQKDNDNQITVFCAASLTNVINQIKSEWEKNHDSKIIINSASSGTLARQIEFGARADIFLSANHDWMDYILEMSPNHSAPKTISHNKLALIASLDSELDSTDFNQLQFVIPKSIDKISVGDPGHVPLGRYTKEALEYYKLYDGIKSKSILAKDARNALRLVELGEAEIGFVYLTDAISSSNVKIIALLPDESHQKIEYEAVLLRTKKSKAKLFFDFLISADADKAWTNHGFNQ